MSGTNNKIKLSVIIPVYNMEADRKLRRCLDSLLMQEGFYVDSDSFLMSEAFHNETEALTTQEHICDVTGACEDQVQGWHYEIIAVDDASTDGSVAILREYERRYPTIMRVLPQAVNRRQGAAKNVGLDAAVGEWVGFVDSDDYVAPDFYRLLLQRAQVTGADVVGCDFQMVDRQSSDSGQVVCINTQDQTGVLDEAKHKKLVVRPGSMVPKIYLRNVLLENHLRFPEGILYEDNCAGPVFSLYFKQFERVEKPLYYYVQYSQSTVHHVTWDNCVDRMRACDCMKQEFIDRGFDQQYLVELEYRFTELFYINTLFSYMQGVKHPKSRHTALLRKRILQEYPHFADNPYYHKWTSEEYDRMVKLHCRSNLRFYWYYRLVLTVRAVKKKIRSKKEVQ
ncbi:MAG: glycosyltransferase [Clostridium sp.]|jgi:glycosyltransferase involved in cell wall biosynthesis|nr:glycosyltransferase [Clostridium sp.]